jgi:4-hydroxy 2-oxovalerate aldolase
MTTILDCTLRDGGYYTKWDFDKDLVDQYIDTMSNLPVDYVEIGYRSPIKEDYYGEYFYLPNSTIHKLRERLNKEKKIAIMINTKDCIDENHLYELVNDCRGIVDMIRFAVSPGNISHAIKLGKRTKELGFELALNIMYLSNSSEEELEQLVSQIVDEIPNIDFVYLVDSYGACYPSEVKQKLATCIKKFPDVEFGFHGHDNIQLAYANTLEAMEVGANIVDSTITGMGRGAGNLSTELICSHFNSKYKCNFDYTDLVNLVEKFNSLKNEFNWGTSLPYMISGLEQLPQGQIMSLVSMKRYSTNNIIKMIKKDELKREVQTIPSERKLKNNTYNQSFDLVVLIGGGQSVSKHSHILLDLTEKYNTLFIHSSLENLKYTNYTGINNLVCLPGDEYKKVNLPVNNFNKYILPNKIDPFGLYVDDNFFFLDETDIDKLFENNNTHQDAPLLMALRAARTLNKEKIFLIGFDGYIEENIKNSILREENQSIIDTYNENFDNKLTSFTETKYLMKIESIYGFLIKDLINA